MTTATFSTVYSFPAPKDKEAKYTNPVLVDTMEDFLTLGTQSPPLVARKHELHNEQQELNAKISEKESGGKRFTGKRVVDQTVSGYSDIPPLSEYRMWGLVRHGEKYHIIRADFPTDPDAEVNRTSPSFSIETTAAYASLQHCIDTIVESNTAPPAVSPDDHDAWVIDLLETSYSPANKISLDDD